MHKVTLAEKIARTIEALNNAKRSDNREWVERWGDVLDSIESSLPSGSGIDRGTRFVMEKCNGDRIVLSMGFHHMDENGYYDGWTDHEIVVTPAFGGFDLRVTGRNRNDVKDYLREVYAHALSEMVNAY